MSKSILICQSSRTKTKILCSCEVLATRSREVPIIKFKKYKHIVAALESWTNSKVKQT